MEESRIEENDGLKAKKTSIKFEFTIGRQFKEK